MVGGNYEALLISSDSVNDPAFKRILNRDICFELTILASEDLSLVGAHNQLAFDSPAVTHVRLAHVVLV